MKKNALTTFTIVGLHDGQPCTERVEAKNVIGAMKKYFKNRGMQAEIVDIFIGECVSVMINVSTTVRKCDLNV